MVTHLSVRTCYTLLDSTIQIQNLVKKAKELGFDSVAITDRNVMFAFPVFLKYCKMYQIKPIFGLEIIVNYHEVKVPFVLLAKDNLGYKNLMKLSSIVCSNNDNFVTLEEFIQYAAHNYVIAYGEGGYFDSDLISENKEAVLDKLKVMKEELPEFDVALSYQEASLWAIKNKMLKQICRQLNISTVALNKVYYLDKQDEETFHILSSIKNQKSIYDQSLTKVKGRYLLSIEEMQKLYDEDDLERTSVIASSCFCDLSIEKTSLPEYPVKDNITQSQYLTQLCLAGLKKRLNNEVTKEYVERIKYELDIIIKMHFENYFLIVYDFIRYAKKHNILIGPGRGSVCGSLCAYCLGITEIDPLKYDLLFERFLNPERISMPDIDTDIPDNKRQDVISYVQNKYGASHVSSIVTFGTFGPKQALRDVGKVMNLLEKDISLVTKQVQSNKVSLREQYKTNKKLRDILNADRNLKKMFDTANLIEGLPKHTSLHAAGVIISKLNINNVVPTIEDNAILTSQYTMEFLEERGLIKMDFLGLKNLTMIDDMVTKIKNIQSDFELPYSPQDDKKVYRILSEANCLGIFQVESEGMKNLLKKMNVSSFEDIVASIALYRPASFGQINIYLENKNHPSTIQYINNEVKKVLESTYGVMIYQEQAMKIAEVCANFTLGKADILRKAISKKKMDMILNMKKDFIDGCLRNHYSLDDATKLFDLIEKFGGYGFNKSHAVAYSLIVYQMAYIKAYYPTVFYATYIDNVLGDASKISECIKEAGKQNISILRPDINSSTEKCHEENQAIRLPLNSIRLLNRDVSNKIIEERKKGKYVDFYDFVARTSLLKVSRSEIEALIYAGALDSFNENRNTLLNALDDAFNYADLIRVEVNGEIQLKYDLVSKQAMRKYADVLDDKIKKEREVLGLYLGKHPIIDLREKINPNLLNLSILKVKKDKTPVQGIAYISNVKEHRTKRGDLMAFVTVSDESDEMTLLVMPRLFSKIQSKLLKNTYIIFTGKMTDDSSCIVDELNIVK